jgi:hypothetical protein
MSFKDEDRNKISIRLSSEQGVIEFFKKNREKLSGDIELIKEKISTVVQTIQDNPTQSEVGIADLLGMIGISTSQLTKAISDLMDITQIAFLQNIQLQKEINDLRQRVENK